MSLIQRIEKLAKLAEQQSLLQVGGALIARASADAADEELERLWSREAESLGWSLPEAESRGVLLVHRVTFPPDAVRPLRDRQQELEAELARLKAEQERLHATDIGVQVTRKSRKPK